MKSISLSGDRQNQISTLILFGFREKDAIKTVDALAGMVPVVRRKDKDGL